MDASYPDENARLRALLQEQQTAIRKMAEYNRLLSQRVNADEREPAIKAVVSLDLGLARGFTPESLSQIAIPVLIMAAQADSDEIPARLESGYLAEYLPAAVRRIVNVEGATHFSFMQGRVLGRGVNSAGW